MNVIDNDQIKEFFVKYPEAIFRQWKKSPPDAWPELRALLEACDALHAHLQHYVDSGKIMEFRDKLNQTGTE